MLLALDVGNTNVTIGVFKRKEIIEVFRITTKLPRTSDEFGILISNLLKEKGYNPVNQIVGYIMSGDPTYITSHNNARSLIMKVERDELVEEVIKYFIEGKGL